MFVLASASKARQKLLDQIALRHRVIVSDFDETKLQELDPILKVKFLAKGKADSALKKLIKENQALNMHRLMMQSKKTMRGKIAMRKKRIFFPIPLPQRGGQFPPSVNLFRV